MIIRVTQNIRNVWLFTFLALIAIILLLYWRIVKALGVLAWLRHSVLGDYMLYLLDVLKEFVRDLGWWFYF